MVGYSGGGQRGLRGPLWSLPLLVEGHRRWAGNTRLAYGAGCWRDLEKVVRSHGRHLAHIPGIGHRSARHDNALDRGYGRGPLETPEWGIDRPGRFL